jgi:cysteine desulfurase
VRRIELDHNAGAPLRPCARAAIALALEAGLGNPSSRHAAGRAAREAIEQARDQVARLVSASHEELVFCSGGTEADNLAVRGAARAIRAANGRRAVVSSPLEHPAVQESLEALAAEGFEVRRCRVDGTGSLDEEHLAALVDAQVALVTLAAANHELGTRYDVARLAALAHARGARFHTDAVQAARWERLDFPRLGVDYASLSAHKLGGPRGAGALYLRRDAPLAPLIVGGHQERGRRPGTEDLLGAVGFGAACAELIETLPAEAAAAAALRDRLEAGALKIDGARRFGGGPRVAGTANLGFRGAPGELLTEALDLEGVAASTGAACSSGSTRPSPVLLALGLAPDEARLAVRFSLGADTSAEEIDRVLALLPRLVARVRAA